jgi:hypothetical protein
MSLLHRAQEHLRVMGATQNGLPSPAESLAAFHSLQVHAIELEMQGEQLRSAQHELEAQRAQYADFYRLAPVGFVSLQADSTIVRINPAASALLGLGESMPNPFGKPQALRALVCLEDAGIFKSCLLGVFAGNGPKNCEVRLQRPASSNSKCNFINNWLGGQDVRASYPLHRKVKVAKNFIHTYHPNRAPAD